MNILEQIAHSKRQEVALKKQVISIEELQKTQLFQTAVPSLGAFIINSDSGIIAEHKRRSPSKPIINFSLDIATVTQGYEDAGAAALSILTDVSYFGGSLEDLQLAKAQVNIPLLRKDFILDTYQVYEAKAHGASAILLIVALLSFKDLSELSHLAQALGMEVLVEVHDMNELEKALQLNTICIGINNRDLKTFTVDFENSMRLLEQIPASYIKISESGIDHPNQVRELKNAGFDGFLIGENFMKTTDPRAALKQFISSIPHEN